ncbi:MAG TPA: DinB family protein [Blastocatellia bacterium]
MKASLKLILAVVMAAAIGAPSLARTSRPGATKVSVQATSLTPEERAALVDLLTKTKQDFIQSVKGLTQAQWEFKPSPFSWSVAQTAEHIILSEDYLFKVSQQLLKAPVQNRTSAASGADEDKTLLTKVGDRSHRVMNPAAITPRGRFKTPDDAIAAFTEARDRDIEYAKTTQDDLRHHLTSDSGGGQLDAYEFLLLMAGHSGRHTMQIKEVEANAKYPSASAY